MQPDESLSYSDVVDFVARNEFDFTIKEVAEGRDWSAIDGLSYRDAERRSSHNRRARRCSRTWTRCRS